MSTQQILELQKIREQIFSLNINSEDLAQFFAEIMDKINPPPKNLPKHIKEGIRQSWEDYANGDYVIFEVGEKFSCQKMEEKFQKLEKGFKNKPLILKKN